MDDVIERFFKVKRAKGISDRTEVSYRETLSQFLGHYLAADPTRTLQDIRSDDIVEFLVYLRDLGRSESTRANRFRTLRNFFNWCQRERLIKVSPVKGVQNPVVHLEAVKPYTRDEIDRMMVATSRRPAQALRDQVAVALLYNTGMRAGELCTLKPEYFQDDTILVTGKGKRQRWLGLEPTTHRLLRLYMNTRRVEHRYVFSLSVTGLYQVIRVLAWHAKVPNAYVHRFRDTFAVRFLEAGGDVETLQTLLGHAEITTTLRYVMYDREKRALVAQRKYAPFAVEVGGRPALPAS